MPMVLPKHVKPSATLVRWPRARSQAKGGIEIPVRRQPATT